MSKKSVEPPSPFRPDPKRQHPLIDESVQLPDQVRRAAAIAAALITGQPVPEISDPNRPLSDAKISLTDAEINKALQHLDCNDLKITGPHAATIIKLAREGARLLKAHRRGARQDRKHSDNVTRRLEALLQAYGELSPKRQANPTGTMTLQALRQLVIRKLGLRDGDQTINEEVIKSDIRKVRPLLRLIERGVIWPPSQPVKKRISERTRQEMEAGAKAIAKATAGGMSRKRSGRRTG